ncbi:MAG: insulinase family protein, partial [Chloroflexaceae bacterium]|nr:insulinase family protein [Chloroflexaceae bacterium]
MPTTVTTAQGLPLLIEELPHTHSVSLGLFIGVGARHETADVSGISHFIEHMCFKGSQRFPTARHISQAIEGVGGILNASTSYESTVYWCKVADIHIQRALDVLTDMVRYPHFDSRELEKERRVIIEELRGSQDSPSEWVHELLQHTMWGDQPLGRDIAGSVESVSAIGHRELETFWRQHYG